MPKVVNLERIKTTRTIFVSGIVIFLSLLLFSVSAPVVNANVIFSDSFSGGFSSTWFVPSGAVAPVVSLHGITAAGTNPWSVIDHTLSGNSIYDIQLDLWVNTNNIVSAWGIGINDGKRQWKNVGNWGPNNLLQIHDSSGSDILVPWNHEIGKHHFEVIVSPLGNTQFIVIEDGNKLTSITSGTNFDITSVEVGLLGYLDYEMANFVLSTVDSTPSPTPTPTPSPVPTTKVVVIPGFGSSWNADAILNCKADNYTGTWSSWLPADAVYNP